jgi:16S rRNA (guanine(966)-N(2))-methyltransferase RsmD
MRLRPTADRVREALFNIIGNRVSGRYVLDLFAGTGAMGLEALSRGASFVVFVDRHPAALQLISRNLVACGNPPSVRVIRQDLRRGLKGLMRQGWHFDLVFLDPPYRRGLGERCLMHLSSGALLTPWATVVSEHGVDENLAPAYGGLQRQMVRSYGTTLLSIYRWENT